MNIGKLYKLNSQELTRLELRFAPLKDIDPEVADIRKDYIHFEALLLKRDGWKIMMEYQKSTATVEEWNALH